MEMHVTTVRQDSNYLRREAVFVVDPDAAVRETLEARFSTLGLRVEAFATLEQYLARPQVPVAGCVVLDISPALLDRPAFAEAVALRRLTPLVFMSQHCDIPMTVRAMKAGAVDFLTKPIHTAALLGAVRSALERSRAALAQESVLSGLKERYTRLSERERDVLRLVVTGLLNKQIGFELGISEITVKAHRGRLMRKMAASSLAELVRMSGQLRLHAG
jgi:FixJ family two-component response regulator